MEWKDIEEFPMYRISNTGLVFSKRRNRILKNKSNGVYANIALKNDLGVFYKYIHRLVAHHFVDNPSQKPMVNHKDGDKLNNHHYNLEWVTKGENQSHAYAIGLRVPSERQRQSVAEKNKKYSSKPVAQLDSDGNIIALFNSGREAERLLGVGKGNITRCASGRNKTAAGFRWRYA